MATEVYQIETFRPRGATDDSVLVMSAEQHQCVQKPSKSNGVMEYGFDAEERRHRAMRECTKTKTVTYRNINPTLSVHNMYTNRDRYVADYRRTEMTRFRVGSHRLKVETGRWSRLPKEERTCLCIVGGVQDEEHVVFKCEYTRDLREKYEVGEVQTLVEVLDDIDNVDFIYEIMQRFK